MKFFHPNSLCNFFCVLVCRWLVFIALILLFRPKHSNWLEPNRMLQITFDISRCVRLLWLISLFRNAMCSHKNVYTLWKIAMIEWCAIAMKWLFVCILFVCMLFFQRYCCRSHVTAEKAIRKRFHGHNQRNNDMMEWDDEWPLQLNVWTFVNQSTSPHRISDH